MSLKIVGQDLAYLGICSVIAVTGLSAHAFGSWAHTPRNMWLRDYLPRDVSNARVLTYGYPSQLHGSLSRSIFSDHSMNFIHRLLNMRESAKVSTITSFQIVAS